MSEKLRVLMTDLKFVANIKDEKLKKNLLKYLSQNPNYYSALREISLNIIKGNVKMSNKTKNKLSKHKKVIIETSKKSYPKEKKQKLVIQSGGWLWILPIVSTVIDLLR